MKSILTILTISSLYIATVWAQASFIGSPAPGTTIPFGSELTVQVVRPNSIEGGIEVGIVITLLACPTTQEAVCPSPAGQLGQILFTGQFAPTLHAMAQIYENFTVSVPPAANFNGETGRAQLAVVRLYLIGVRAPPYMWIPGMCVLTEMY
ncbi:hypothetical protein B0H16DRAFT_1708998 [Mycena metata]|uniref:Uncharacterized protein n=1 Tax=Mycena metata TaxID=1033252 RepID=A0AAD7DUT2_9AGAR|nr:hypothetical protein B0H16DRAFT_1749110 [Mycena metata]KAJ7741148.1 hypothetical protein B0H16DRAFT_1728792 [Mycena metata]KAJ7784272.1 hypothetical protein B0H16DRAFT_1708998 [Mycena metata]